MVKKVNLRVIAEKAGVSLATVDRIVNNRPNVSANTKWRVQKVIEQLDFHTGHSAEEEIVERDCYFQFIVPRGPKNTFMVNMKKDIEEMTQKFAAQRVFLSFSDYTELDEVELTRALAQVGPATCTGVAVIAIDSIHVREAIDRLVRKGVIVATLVSDVTPSQRHFSIGPNNIATGRTAASLIGKFAAGRSGPVAALIGSRTLCDQADRRFGFEQVLTQEYPSLKIVSVPEGRDDSAITKQVVQDILSQSSDLIGIYNIGAGNRGLIEALEERGREKDIIVVAHELTKHTRNALISGTIDALINQDSRAEIELAIASMKAYATGDIGYVPPSVPIDIYMRYNLP
ncbi:LacI family transcriptional regulator [Cohaesibacter marisflavi]|uniref:LacI family transcriptional regulator n=1 Tax=Cohaesibacter marisflavi TaxID=655353 RepID=A0A1I5ME65_9HYPH|nr:LacI family DNA-binding transcriptional regulator [Cohaesibacter marisflavi]SFP07865.1 LacI family transcriptional regulator [Cohaesibacter marisflavi]